MTDERRANERHGVRGDLIGEVTTVQSVRVIEISVGGALVEISGVLVPESLHDFRLALGDHHVVVKGRVAHCRVVEVEHERVVYRAGIEFVQLQPHAATAIREYVEHAQGLEWPGDGG